jgi:DNA-binding transcriptional ArsR family regulator
MDRKQILEELVNLNRLEPRAEDEFTYKEYSEAEGVSLSTARARLARWEQAGLVEKREGIRQRDNRKMTFCRVLDWEKLKAHLEKKPNNA